MNYATYRNTRVFAALDGLRCISIIAVVWHHAAGGSTRIPLLGRGYFGVTLFFVISGYLITTLLLRERDSYGSISLSRFYARRTLRIAPLYYTVILIYVGLVVVVDRHSRAGDAFLHHNLLNYLTYTANWFVPLDDTRVIFYFAWSLAAEEQFYLVWPSVERFGRGRWPVLAAVGLLVAPVAAATVAGGHLLDGAAPVRTVLVHVPAGICLGVLLAHLLHSARGYRVAAAVVGRRWASPVLLAALIAGLAVVPVGGTAGVLVITGLMALLVGSCVVREDHGLRRLLTFRPVAWIGVISYGMYLLHMLAINVAAKALGAAGLDRPVARFLLGVALVVAAASASHRWYESIFLRRKERFSRRGQPAAAAAPAGAVAEAPAGPLGAGAGHAVAGSAG